MTHLADSVVRHQPKTKRRTALILYGSETGNAQDVAEEVGRLAERLRFDTTVLDLDSFELRDVKKYTLVVFALSTAGQGEMPQNARSFWNALLSGDLKPGILGEPPKRRPLLFTSFGLGDSSYPRYNVASRMLYNRLTDLGARPFCKPGEGNEQHPEGHSAGLREWIVQLKQSMLQTFPLPDGVAALGDDEFLEPRWKLSLAGGSLEQTAAVSSDDNVEAPRLTHENSTNGANESHSSPSAKIDHDEALPSLVPIPVRDSYSADLVANERVTSADHFQDVRLLDLRLDRDYSYGPGAVAVVYPKNFPADVDEFIKLMHWEDVADRPVELIRSRANASGQATTPSPLRHLDLGSTNLTLRWLLENVIDIMSIPRRSFFANLSHFAGTRTDDEEFQKERLLELANPELIDELWDYTTRPKRTILEVMMDFTTIQIPWQYALSALPLMRGRQFSIASGGDSKQDAKGRTRVQLLVAIADPPSPIIKWRRRYGVCTRYIITLQPGQKINIGMQQGYLDAQPSELEAPVVMIGPGTGVAPMRAMAQQRHAWGKKSKDTTSGKHLENDILLFGCRGKSTDYFFKDEWEQLSHIEGLQVWTAFSRDKDEPRSYVQDQIRQHASAVYRAVRELNGRIYVCGSSGNMPKGVREAFLDILVEQSASMSREEAEAHLDGMEKAGRYKQETW
jgi:sulfite reductase alpha subunit-like flavoprotein